MKYFIYVRKSTDTEDKQVLSIEAQLAELAEHSEKERLEIAASFEEAKTAKEPGRTVFAEMLARIEQGEAQGILSWHPDRLARNSIDGGRIIYLLDTGKLLDLKFPTFWFESTPQGKFMLNIAFGQSKYYIDNLSENVKRGNRQKLRRGLWPTVAPLGYINNRKTRGIDPDPEMAPLIRKAFETYSTGEYTLKQIRDMLKEEGLRNCHGNALYLSGIEKLLKRPIYCGLMLFKGELYEGIHESIVPKKLFDEVQRVFVKRGKKHRQRKNEYPFLGMMQCASCGCSITAERQKGHVYYRCTKKKGQCSERYAREESLVDQMQETVEQFSLPESIGNKMLAKLDGEAGDTKREKQASAQLLTDDKSNVEMQLQTLLDLRLAGELTTGEYRAKKSGLLHRKSGIEEQIRQCRNGGTDRLEPVRMLIKDALQAKDLASKDNKPELRAFLLRVGSNLLLERQRLRCEAKKGWRVLRQRPHFRDWQPHGESNPGYMAENHVS